MPFDTKTLKRDGSGITPVPQHFNPAVDDYEAILGRNGASRVELYGPDGNPISTSGGKLAVRASEIETLLSDIKGKDYATQTTLAAILDKIIAAPATEAKQTALNALIGEVQAVPTANTLLARLKNLETKVDAIIADGIKLSGSMVQLGLIDKDTIVTAGSNIVVVPRASRLDYKSVRANIRWGATTTSSMVISFHVGDTDLSSGSTNILNLTDKVNGTGEARVDSEWWGVVVNNTSASDGTLKYIQVLGVK